MVPSLESRSESVLSLEVYTDGMRVVFAGSGASGECDFHIWETANGVYIVILETTLVLKDENSLF